MLTSRASRAPVSARAGPRVDQETPIPNSRAVPKSLHTDDCANMSAGVFPTDPQRRTNLRARLRGNALIGRKAWRGAARGRARADRKRMLLAAAIGAPKDDGAEGIRTNKPDTSADNVRAMRRLNWGRPKEHGARAATTTQTTHQTDERSISRRKAYKPSTFNPNTTRASHVDIGTETAIDMFTQSLTPAQRHRDRHRHAKRDRH